MKHKRNTTSAGAWKDGRSWSTIDEMDFIDGLGTFSDAGKEIGRDELLNRYAQAMDARADWGTMDAGGVKAHARDAMDVSIGAPSVYVAVFGVDIPGSGEKKSIYLHEDVVRKIQQEREG